MDRLISLSSPWPPVWCRTAIPPRRRPHDHVVGQRPFNQQLFVNCSRAIDAVLDLQIPTQQLLLHCGIAEVTLDLVQLPVLDVLWPFLDLFLSLVGVAQTAPAWYTCIDFCLAIICVQPLLLKEPDHYIQRQLQYCWIPAPN